MIVLYHALHSTCSQKVRICLYEKGVAWESRLVAIDRKEHLTQEYLRLNQNGVVPTLVDDGQPIVDSSVICEYLDERFPVPSLVPGDPVRRAGMRVHLGGIGKGFAVDRAAIMLRSHGINDFMVQSGGDLYAAGRHGDRPWRAAEPPD